MIYVQMDNENIKSQEYHSALDKLTKHKYFNFITEEGLTNHIYRNKNQYHKAPKNLNTMEEFVKRGYFYREGFSPCHNIPLNLDTKEYRKLTFKQMIECVKKNLLDKPNIFSPMQNVSYRGIPDTDFEGCQFVYNFKTQKLVTDCVNRGTWDFGKPGTPAHFILDVKPWVKYGNGDNIEKEKDFIMNQNDEDKYLSTPVKQFVLSNGLIIVDSEKTLNDLYEEHLSDV